MRFKMLEIKNLSYSYNKKKETLHNISFELCGSKIGVILGPNGSGKSTLLKLIAGINKTDKNHIFYNKKDLTLLKSKERAKLISYVPQSFHFSSLTVYESILLSRLPYLNFKPTDKDKEIVLSSLKKMQIENLAMNDVTTLSQGQKQKVLVARSLAQEAKLLLFDEPTSSLDIESQLNTISLIKKTVKENNLSSLISIHDINLALLIGDVFFFIKDGEIKYAGGEEIITKEVIKEIYSADVDINVINNKKNVIYKEANV